MLKWSSVILHYSSQGLINQLNQGYHFIVFMLFPLSRLYIEGYNAMKVQEVVLFFFFIILLYNHLMTLQMYLVTHLDHLNIRESNSNNVS